MFQGMLCIVSLYVPGGVPCGRYNAGSRKRVGGAIGHLTGGGYRIGALDSELGQRMLSPEGLCVRIGGTFHWDLNRPGMRMHSTRHSEVFVLVQNVYPTCPTNLDSSHFSFAEICWTKRYVGTSWSLHNLRQKTLLPRLLTGHRHEIFARNASMGIGTSEGRVRAATLQLFMSI